jgi:hypothetical protein
MHHNETLSLPLLAEVSELRAKLSSKYMPGTVGRVRSLTTALKMTLFETA